MHDRLASKQNDVRHSLHFVSLMQGVRPMYKKAETFLCEQAPSKCLRIFIRTSLSNRKKRTNPKAPTSSKSVLHSGSLSSLSCHSRTKRGALGKSIVAKCNVYKIYSSLVAANLTAR